MTREARDGNRIDRGEAIYGDFSPFLRAKDGISGAILSISDRWRLHDCCSGMSPVPLNIGRRRRNGHAWRCETDGRVGRPCCGLSRAVSCLSLARAPGGDDLPRGRGPFVIRHSPQEPQEPQTARLLLLAWLGLNPSCPCRFACPLITDMPGTRRAGIHDMLFPHVWLTQALLHTIIYELTKASKALRGAYIHARTMQKKKERKNHFSPIPLPNASVPPRPCHQADQPHARAGGQAKERAGT